MRQRRELMEEKRDERYVTASGYRWNRGMVLPYESIWGIIQLFKYINRLRNGDILSRPSSCTRWPTLSEERAMFNEEYCIYGSFGNILEDLSIPNGHFEPFWHKRYGGIAGLSRIYTRGIRTSVWYCKECMKYGYHSYYHQRACAKRCFIHGCRLIKSDIFPYAVSTGTGDGPYQAYGKEWGAGSPLEELTKIIKGRHLLLKRINGVMKQPEISFYRTDPDKYFDPDDAVWDKEPFKEIKKEKSRDEGRKLFELLMERAGTGSGEKWAVWPDRLIICAEMEDIKKKYGEDNVIRCITAFYSLWYMRKFADSVSDSDQDMTKKVLLLLMFLGTDRITELLETDNFNVSVITDFYGFSLRNKFFPDSDMQPVDFKRSRMTDCERSYVSILLALQFMKDISDAFPDVQSCCRHISRRLNQKHPVFFYRAEKDQYTGNIRLYKGKIFCK